MTTTDTAPLTAREAMHFLAACGTAMQIASFLLEQQCAGRVGDGEACPVSRYLTRFGSGVVTVDGLMWMDSDGRERVTPEAVTQFVMLFDDGEFPELIESTISAGSLL